MAYDPSTTLLSLQLCYLLNQYSGTLGISLQRQYPADWRTLLIDELKSQ